MAGASLVFDIFAKDHASDKFDRVGRSADGATGKFKKFATLGALAVAGAAVVAGKALVGMAKNAAEDEAAQRRLGVALKNTAGATKSQIKDVETWISKMGVATGVSDDQMRPSLQRLVQSTGDIGKAQKLMGLALDASAGSGKSLETVSTALAKAQSGNMGALSRLGIRIKDTEGKTLSFNEVTKQMAKTFGGQAAAQADSFDGKMQRLKLIFDETKESIGAKLLPVAEKLASWFIDKGLPAITAFGKFLGDKLGPIIAKVRAVFSGNMSGISGDVSKNFAAIKSTISSVVSIITSLWHRFGGTIMAYARSTFNNLRTIISGALTVISGVFKTFAALLKGDWSGVWDGLKQILSGAWTLIKGLIAQGWNQIKTIFRLAGQALKGIFGGVWTGIQSLVSTGVTNFVNGVRSIPGKVLALGKLFLNAGKGLIGKFISGLGAAAGFAANFANQIWNAVKSAINAGISTLNGLLEFDIKVKGIGIHVNAPDIPHLAKGGIVSRPTVALIGEAGPEAVVPLSAGRNRGGFGGGDINITITGALDPTATAKQVQKILLQLKRTNGGQNLGLA